MRILITGASGLLGSKIAETALSRGHDVFACYNTRSSRVGHPLKFDLTGEQVVFDTLKNVYPDAVVHSAALTDVDYCEKNREIAYRINVEGTRNIVRACGGKVFLAYVSTDYVFSGEKGMYKEEEQTAPVDYYGLTKLEGEIVVTNSSLDYLIARPSVIYGSKPASGKVNFALWALDRLKKGQYVRVLVDQFTSPTLNSNLARMMVEAIERRLTGIYHMAGSTRISRYNFVLELAKAFKLDMGLINEAKMQEMNWTARRPRDSSLDVGKAGSCLGNKPLEISDAVNILKSEVEAFA